MLQQTVQNVTKVQQLCCVWLCADAGARSQHIAVRQYDDDCQSQTATDRVTACTGQQ